jgi:hypothetical protein
MIAVIFQSIFHSVMYQNKKKNLTSAYQNDLKILKKY